MERRLLLLNVSYRLGGFNSWELPESFFERADRFIESVTENSGRFYDKENKEILLIGFAISFLRQQVCAVTIDSKFIEEIKNVLFTIMSNQHGKTLISKPIIKRRIRLYFDTIQSL